ncbi:hypothetical protein F2Q70_00032085 [Brassica cretica]|uniref:Uncharacterized protein n=1 Tax=Brassica cretica TaxID=69181 RepID=A0A8S9FL20_BRACR|nr:hypothetical protein F2Q70_00032085 [Brassica cretica]
MSISFSETMMKIRKEKRLLQRNQLQVKARIEARMKLIQEARSDLMMLKIRLTSDDDDLVLSACVHCLVFTVLLCMLESLLVFTVLFYSSSESAFDLAPMQTNPRSLSC